MLAGGNRRATVKKTHASGSEVPRSKLRVLSTTTKEGRKTIAKVAREMVDKIVVNGDQPVELLVKNAAAELTSFYYYTILRINPIGLEEEGIKEIAETARIEDRIPGRGTVWPLPAARGDLSLGGQVPATSGIGRGEVRWRFEPPL